MAASTLRLPRRTTFMCATCGDEAPKWAGRCHACGAWNSLVETPAESGRRRAAPEATAAPLAVDGDPDLLVPSGMGEVDRVLGGGLVAGSVVLLGGDPGVGKSTLALQIAAAAGGGAALYCTGEENERQVGLRAARLACAPDSLSLLVSGDLDSVLAAISAARHRLAVVDSVQTLVDPAVPGGAGSVSQVRSAVARIVQAAKASAVTVILIGHVTKEGAIAGPRTLEHMVDVVLYLEGDRLGERRVLRGIKNRFGSTGEVGLFAMDAHGLRDVPAPERSLLDGASLGVSGSVLTVTCDGLRPRVVEIQGLAVKSSAAVPRRTCSGFDFNRLCLLLAVLEKRCSLGFGGSDVFLNVAGGIRLDDPGADLAVALAAAGSMRNRTLPAGWAACGEVGLVGEVRPVARIEARAAEAAAAGVTDLVVPALRSANAPHGVRLHPVATVADGLALLA